MSDTGLAPAAVVLSDEQKLLLFKEFAELQKQQEQQKSDTDPQKKEGQNSKEDPNNKRRKRNDDHHDDHSHASESDFMIEGTKSTSSKSKEKVEDWLSKSQKNDDLLSVIVDDPIDDLFKEDSPEGVEVNDKEIEGILRSRYSKIMEHTKEKMGDPLVPMVQKLVNTTWGKLQLAAKTKTALLEKIEIPVNCKDMKAPRLNTEVYIRIYENAANKDKAMMDRQRDISKAAIPVLKAMGELEKVKTIMEKNLKEKGKENVSDDDKDSYKGLKKSLDELENSVLMLNYNFTETTRRRKFDVCQALGAQFRPYATSDDTGEYLFGVETQKLMKSELKKVSVKAKKTDQAKNSPASGKAHRSFQGGANRFTPYKNSNYSQNNRGSNQNHYNNNSNNYNNNQNRNQPRRAGRGKKY